MGKLGKPWTFVSPGVSIKPFPSGSLSHPGMTEMERLIKENQIKPEQVELNVRAAAWRLSDEELVEVDGLTR